MGFGYKQPLVGEKRCVTTLITAAKETIRNQEGMIICIKLVSRFKQILKRNFGLKGIAPEFDLNAVISSQRKRKSNCSEA